MADMSETFAAAAKGDPVAQATMLDHMVMTALQPGAVCPEFLAVIEMWARMLATHGRAEDNRRLAGVLIFKGSILRLAGRLDVSERLVDQGLFVLQRLAEDGDERAPAQAAELSRRLTAGQSIPAEIMLGDAAPTSH
jgi:hypothetical protein